MVSLIPWISTQNGITGISQRGSKWRGQTPYAADSDWVFASSYNGGELPYWPDSVLKRTIQPAAKRAGLLKVVGWHTFRHSYSCLLRANHTGANQAYPYSGLNLVQSYVAAQFRTLGETVTRNIQQHRM